MYEMSNNYILSLTTIPSKFDNLHLTMDSLVNQTITPTKIVVNIPKVYDFRMNHSKIPQDKIDAFIEKYSNHNVIINVIDKDFGSGTKLLGLLQSDIVSDMNTTNTYIILVDDDLIYRPLMIENFNRYIKLHDLDVCSHNVGTFYNIRAGQGADGFSMKLNTLDKFLQYFDIIKDQEYLLYHDDFYISYYFYLINKYIHLIPCPIVCPIFEMHDNSLINTLSHLQGEHSRENLNRKSSEILTELNNTGCFDVLHQ